MYDLSNFIGDLFYISGWIKNYQGISKYLKTNNLTMLAFLEQTGMLPNSSKNPHIYTKSELEAIYEVIVIN